MVTSKKRSYVIIISTNGFKFCIDVNPVVSEKLFAHKYKYKINIEYFEISLAP